MSFLSFGLFWNKFTARASSSIAWQSKMSLTWQLAGQCASVIIIYSSLICPDSGHTLASSFTCQQRPRSLPVAAGAGQHWQKLLRRAARRACHCGGSIVLPGENKSCGGASFGRTAHWRHSTGGSHADEAGGRTTDMAGTAGTSSDLLVGVKRRTGNARRSGR